MQFNPRNEQEILVTPMRHAAVVVTLAASSQTNSELGGKTNVKDKDISEKADNKDGVKDSNVATHHIVPLEDEVL